MAKIEIQVCISRYQEPCPFIVQDGESELIQAKTSIPQVVVNVSAWMSGPDQLVVPVNSILETSLFIRLICSEEGLLPLLVFGCDPSGHGHQENQSN